MIIPALTGLVVMFVTEASKKTGLHGSVLAIIFSLVAGIVYTVAQSVLPEEIIHSIVQFGAESFTVATMVYNVINGKLKQ